MSDTNLAVPTQNLFAVTSNWLDTEKPQTSTALTNTVALGDGLYPSQWYPNHTYWYYQPLIEHRPIRLGLSEVEKLRSAAKRDAKLKKILEKLTDLIEVTVDFK